MTLRYAHKSFLHAIVVSIGGKAWDLIAVYASPNPRIRCCLWTKLKALLRYGLRLFIGDFNCVLRGDERSSNGRESTTFVDWVDNSGLVDLGFSGPNFTWKHSVNLATRCSARLDRALCDVDWRQLLSEASVRHLPHCHSDHCLCCCDLRRMGSLALLHDLSSFRTHGSHIENS